MRDEEELDFIIARVQATAPNTSGELLETYRRELEHMNSLAEDSNLALREQFREWRSKWDALTDRGEELKEVYDLARLQLKAWYEKNLTRIILQERYPDNNNNNER